MTDVTERFDHLLFAAFQNEIDPTHPNGLAIVKCKCSKGREFPVLCIVTDEDNGAYYMPYALMITEKLDPLMAKLHPPENLKGVWTWGIESELK